MGEWLDEISRSGVGAGRHMLSALVVQARGDRAQEPGEGFYKCAKDLGFYIDGDSVGFWKREVKWLHEHWSSH